MTWRRGETTAISLLEADPAEVWERVFTPEGINDELAPLMKMTVPRGLESFDPARIEVGEPLGRSWILLGGLVPIDYDDLTLVRLDPGEGFLERSKMLSQRLWEHERTVEPAGIGGCRVTDRVAWEPRLPLPGAILRPLFAAIFRHRHRRLRSHFGGNPER